MLVMYTLNNSIASKLPQSSDIKFVDIWINFGLLLLFVIIILIILIEHLPEKNNVVFVSEKQDNQKNSKISLQEVTKQFSQLILPILEILFLFCYAITACIIYYNNFN